MLDACLCFESGEPKDFTQAGAVRHNALTRLLNDDFDWDSDLSDEESSEGIEWAAAYIKDHNPAAAPLICEQKMSLMADDFSTIMSGTPDVRCGTILFDLKWRERDYTAQMAAYALMMMQEMDVDEIYAHLLFGAPQRSRVIIFNRATASEIVFGLLARANAPDTKPTPCDYCGWCAKVLTCPAHIQRVKAIEAGREDWKPEQFHASKVVDATEMGKMLRLARQVNKWCKAVEHHAKEMATKKGLVPDGFEVGSRSGKMFVTSAAEAFTLASLPQEEFLKTCAVRLNSSKTYPDQVGLIETFAAFNGLKKAPAKRAVLEKLAPVIKSGNPSVTLKAVSGEEEEEE